MVQPTDLRPEVDVRPMDDVARELGLVLRTLKGMHSEVITGAGAKVELSSAAALAALQDRGQLRLSALAEALHLDLSSVSRQVAALEREGWVARERDPADSRATLLQLTAAGTDVLARLRAARVAHLETTLTDWSERELADFATSLRRFRCDLTRAPSARLTDQAPAFAGQENR